VCVWLTVYIFLLSIRETVVTAIEAVGSSSGSTSIRFYFYFLEIPLGV